MKPLTGLTALLMSCVSTFGAEGDINVFSTARTNAETGTVYVKDVFTRDGQTNLVRILKITPQGTLRVYHFYHAGQLVGNFVAVPGDATFNTEAGPCCMSLKYGPSGEIRSARIGDKEGLLLDEFGYTNGVFAPVQGPLRQNGLMKPKFDAEAGPAQSNAPRPFAPVTTMVITTNTLLVFVDGEVKRPDRQDWAPGLTLTRAIGRAGGFTDFAQRSRLSVRHRDGSAEQYSYSEILNGAQSDPTLRRVIVFTCRGGIGGSTG